MGILSGFAKMGFVENYGLIILLKEDSIYCPCLHTWCVGGKIWAKPLAMKWSFGIIFALTVLYGALYFSISNVTYLKYCFTKVRNEIAKLRESIIFENSREFLKFIFKGFDTFESCSIEKLEVRCPKANWPVQIFKRFFLWSLADLFF